MAAAAILFFEIAKFYWLLECWESRRISMPNFVKIGRLVAKLLRFFHFSRWWLSAILDLFGVHLDNPHEYLGLCHSAKFRNDRCSSFYNMNISIFGTFGWKMPIHAPKIGVFGNLIPQMGCNINQSQKRHTIAWVLFGFGWYCSPSRGSNCPKKQFWGHE